MVSRIERVPIFTRRRLAAALLILDAGPLPPICISGEKGSDRSRYNGPADLRTSGRLVGQVGCDR